MQITREETSQTKSLRTVQMPPSALSSVLAPAGAGINLFFLLTPLSISCKQLQLRNSVITNNYFSNWAYVLPGVSCETVNTCWLKSGAVPGQSVNPCRVAGVVNN
jgi:hypothetical protein